MGRNEGTWLQNWKMEVCPTWGNMGIKKKWENPGMSLKHGTSEQANKGLWVPSFGSETNSMDSSMGPNDRLWKEEGAKVENKGLPAGLQ